MQIAMAIMVMSLAASNAATKGSKRWLITLYWSAVSAYWAVVTFMMIK